MQLSGQTAIISGGLGDIGRAISLELGDRGAKIAICDLHHPQSGPAIEFASQLHDRQIAAAYQQVDVSDAMAVEHWYDEVEQQLGLPTLIVPNAAVVSLVRICDLTSEQWNREMRVNLDGAFYMAQCGAKRMVSAKQAGRIVFIGSWVGLTPQSHIPAYCVTKAGLRMLCKVMALDLAENGILVNEVAPGNVDAGLSARIFEMNPEWKERNLKRVPIGEMSQAFEVAFQVAHLCDPANRQMTGSVILMDGGLSLMSGPNPDMSDK
jgi:NAD(P)-dependent dehydrogenase (short-subunit alcohol dehydrogenase family)